MTKKLILGMVVSASILSACSNKDSVNNEKLTVNSTAIEKDGSLGSKEKAEKLAQAAEQLMTPMSFMFADEVADAALTYDSSNARARLIKALLGPAMLNKGIFERIKPIAYRNEKSKAAYDKFLADAEKWPNSAIKTFLTQGQQDIKTEADAQNHLSQVEAKYEALRQTLKELRTSELTLHIPDNWQQDALERRYKECPAQKVGEGQYEINCDVTHAFEIKMSVADFDAARQIVAGMEIFQILLNSYRADGAIAVADKFNGSGVSGRIVYQELLKDKNFGKLRSAGSLKRILEMGLDAVAGIRWAQERQTELCANGDFSETTNRPGFLFEKGICVAQNDDIADSDTGETVGSVLATVEMALRGGVISQKFTNEDTGRTVVADIRPAAVFSNPVKNVRDLGVISYDNCDRITGFGDSTLGGLFVNGDGNSVIAITKHSCGK